MQSSGIALVAWLIFLAATEAAAQNFETSVDTTGIRARVLEQAEPSFPSGNLRTGQEGWARVNFVVSATGKAIDPIVVDSIGGAPFERATLEALARWRFEADPAGAEIGNNVVEMRYEIYRGRDMATANFMRRYRRIMTSVAHERTAEAREQLQQTTGLGGWNLYESAMLSLMAGRIEGQEGDPGDKLEYYRRALGVDNGAALSADDRDDVLMRILEAEVATGQLGTAQRTLERLENLPGGERQIDIAGESVSALRSRLSSKEDFVARGKLSRACDCEEGNALWRYTPARPVFAFANVAGGAKTFELRCNESRVRGEVVDGGRHELPASAENCVLFVFGDDGASVELVESRAAGAARGVATMPLTPGR